MTDSKVFLKALIAHCRSHVLYNLIGGKWQDAGGRAVLIDPLGGRVPLLHYPDTQSTELGPFIESLKSCPKSGLHNPFKAVERYLMLAQVSFRAAAALEDEAVARHFASLIQEVMPKSWRQCMGEVTVVRQFLKNFGGDQVRFLARGTVDPGDYAGQQPQHFRWPYGPVVIVSPYNFPLEIPALQLIGALYMGNRPLVKAASKVSLVIEQFIRLLHLCGLPMTDVDLIHCSGHVMSVLLMRARHIVRMVQFTGSSDVAEDLAKMLHGKIRVEDAGFDWKILGPDIKPEHLDYVAWQCDQDAYAASGQKCSAQSMLFVPEQLVGGADSFFQKLAALAEKRNLADLTVGPVLTWTTKAMLDHVWQLTAIPGASLLFGGRELSDHAIPACYGALEPTAIFVPLDQMLKPEYYALATTEVFGPVQVVTTYGTSALPLVLEACERMENHLTAAVVSDDPVFINAILGATVNGTTYAGIRARTTGAPQNHWFGPCGDPRSAGIGTPEAIWPTWTAAPCVVRHVGPSDLSAARVQS